MMARIGSWLALVALSGCGNVSRSSPCHGIDCSGHGQCYELGDGARCECEAGFEASGLACVETDAGPDADTDVDSDTDADTDTETTCDRDLDGYESAACGGNDCDDSDDARHPGADDNVGALVWSQEPIATAGDVGAMPSVVADADGHVHVAYHDVTNDDVVYATDASGVWATEIVDDTDWSPIDIALAVGADGVVQLIWDDPAALDLHYATNESGPWEVENANDPLGVDRHVSIAVAEDGTAHVAYTGDGHLVYGRREAGVWTRQDVDPDDGTGGTDFPTLRLEADTPHIVYTVSPASEWIIRHARKTISWETEPVDAPGFASMTSLAIDADGGLHVSYWDELGNRLRYAEGTWGDWTPRTLDDGAGRWSSLAIDDAGVVHVTYTDTNDLFHGVLVGDALEIDVVDSAGDSPSGVVVAAGALHVVYREMNRFDLLEATRPLPDGVDQDCDGVDGEDGDGDGHASLETGGDDCDDADPGRFEGC